MPRLFFLVKSQEKADYLKSNIPKIVNLINRPPNTIEFYMQVDEKTSDEKASIFLYDLEERRTKEFQEKIIGGIEKITSINSVELIFIKKENWILKERVCEICQDSKI
ncbi:hypothetical protein HYX19_04760 [Candidatus Woesearchaeota archaeon]|nr:hypothetical protein [Candidatus Woesearchaeota archaeon]MBI2673547.1 hypothetical protein [Candidatus Woesearchaeota archaeon]